MKIEENEGYYVEPDLAEAEAHAVTDWANPNCPICHGSGLRPISDKHMGVDRDTFCKCVLINQRRAVAEKRIENTFGPNWRRFTFQNFKTEGDPMNEQALQAAKNYVDEFPTFNEQGYGFGLSGAPRSGKTHLITATTIALIKRWNLKPFLLSVPRMIRLEKERFNNPDLPSPIENATQADICILDDLGAEYKKQSQQATHDLSWVEEQLYLILDERIKRSAPTLYTTNLSAGELDAYLQERISSRLKNIIVSNYELMPVKGVNEPATEFRDILNKQKNKT